MRDELTAGFTTLQGHEGHEIEAYVARPGDGASSGDGDSGGGPYGGVVVIHHMPGFDRSSKEIVRRFAAAGYLAIAPNLHHREAPGADPDDAAAANRAAGGVPDDRLSGDVGAAAAWLRAQPGSNGRVGTIGYCSGGRQSFLAGCTLDLQAAVDCYGAFVVEDVPEGFPIDVKPLRDEASDLSCPLLGLFGADDSHPAPEHVKQLDELLTGLGKAHEFHSYDGAGHAFFDVDRPSYRPEAAKDGWERVFAFFETTLVKGA